MFTRGFGGPDHCSWFIGRYLYGSWGLIMLVAVVLTAIIVSILVIQRTKKNDTSNDVLERLKLRYVNGELTEEEYLQKKKTLSE